MRRALLVLALLLCGWAHAAGITPMQAALSSDDEGAVLAAEFAIALNPQLEDALHHGIVLPFKLEFTLERPRQFWVAEHIATYTLNYRLSYSGLTRQYRVAHGSFQQSYPSLEAALGAISRVGGLPVVERSALLPGTQYEAAVRLSLDRTQLPKPFQLDALTGSEWRLDAGTRRWRWSSP